MIKWYHRKIISIGVIIAMSTNAVLQEANVADVEKVVDGSLFATLPVALTGESGVPVPQPRLR